jgi:hypothetical protein
VNVDFDVIPPASDEERIVLERALELVAPDGRAGELRAASRWWRAGAVEALGTSDEDGAEPDAPTSYARPPYAFSPRRTRGATRA